MNVVIFNHGSKEFPVNVDHISGVRPNEAKPESGSFVNVFGKEFKVRGSSEAIMGALEAKVLFKIGFGDGPNDVDFGDARNHAGEVEPDKGNGSPPQATKPDEKGLRSPSVGEILTG